MIDPAQSPATLLDGQRRMLGLVLLATIAWLVVVRCSPATQVLPNTAFVTILLGTSTWTAAAVYRLRWHEPGVWMFMCIGFANGLFFLGLLRFAGPFSSTGRGTPAMQTIDLAIAGVIAAWCVRTVSVGIAANFRLSRDAGALFGSHRRPDDDEESEEATDPFHDE